MPAHSSSRHLWKPRCSHDAGISPARILMCVSAEHRELVIKCLVDDDITIRLVRALPCCCYPCVDVMCVLCPISLIPPPSSQRALELIAGMVTRKNLTDIVRRLSENVENAEVGMQAMLLRPRAVFSPPRVEFHFTVCACASYTHTSTHRVRTVTPSSTRSSSCAPVTSTSTWRTSRGTSPSSSS